MKKIKKKQSILKKYKNISKNVLTNIGERYIIKSTKENRTAEKQKKSIEREVRST